LSAASDASSTVIITDSDEAREIHNKIVESFKEMSETATINEQHYPEHAIPDLEPPKRKKLAIDNLLECPRPAIRRKSNASPSLPQRKPSVARGRRPSHARKYSLPAINASEW